MKWSLGESPVANDQAQREALGLEAHGYRQVDSPVDLGDGEDVILLAENGGIAPARFHSAFGAPDEHGRRRADVFEIWPGSRYSDTLPWSEMQTDSAEGQSTSRIAIYRAMDPAHAGHGPILYAERSRRST